MKPKELTLRAACDHLYQALSRWVGPDGCHALFTRAAVTSGAATSPAVQSSLGLNRWASFDAVAIRSVGFTAIRVCVRIGTGGERSDSWAPIAVMLKSRQRLVVRRTLRSPAGGFSKAR
jgi:hypothetical protein